MFQAQAKQNAELAFQACKAKVATRARRGGLRKDSARKAPTRTPREEQQAIK